MADPFQALFNQYTVRDPATGRYFLPFANTLSGMDFARRGSGFIGDGGTQNIAGQNDEPNRDVPTGATYTSLNDYFNALDPSKGFYVTGANPDGSPIAPSNAQNALYSHDATRGTYNDQPGYFFNPASLGGAHPAMTSGGKPNDTGLWQMLSLFLPLAGELTGVAATAGAGAGSAGSDAAAGTGAFGGSVPAAAGSGAAISGSAGGATLAGDAGEDAATTTAPSTGGDMGYYDDYTGQWVDTSQMGGYQYDPYSGDVTGNPNASEYDPYNYQGGNTNEGFSYNTEPPAGTDQLYETLKKYYGDAKTALSAYNTIKGGGSKTGGGSVLGAGLGALLGSAGGSKPAGTTTSIQDIPDWQKSLLIPALQQSQGLLAKQQQYGYPLLGPAQDQMGRTISGDYLNPATNPYLRDTYDQAAKAVTDNYSSTVQPRNDAMFYKAGAFGPSNSAYDETVARNQFGLGQNLKNLATDIYGGNYSRERQNQLTATTAAPDYSAALLGAQWAPYKNFLGVAGGGFGNTQTQPYFTNKLGNVFGGALLGSQLLG